MVSTHSRPKAAGIANSTGVIGGLFQLTAARRRLDPNVISGGLAASEIYLLEQTGSGGGIRGILGGIFFGFDRMGGIPDGTELYNVDSSDDVWIKFEMDDSSSPQHDFSCLINATAWDM